MLERNTHYTQTHYTHTHTHYTHTHHHQSQPLSPAGLSQQVYWMISYCFDYLFFILVMLLMLAISFAFQIRLFTQVSTNELHYLLEVLTLCMYTVLTSGDSNSPV